MSTNDRRKVLRAFRRAAEDVGGLLRAGDRADSASMEDAIVGLAEWEEATQEDLLEREVYLSAILGAL